MDNAKVYNKYLDLLKKELVPALGCTEPIAIAYASAKAREVLGVFPENIVVECSGNIIKNVKSVIVPTTSNLRGVEASAILGIVGGNADKMLEVLADIKQSDVEKTRELLKTDICKVVLNKGVTNLYIKIVLQSGKDSASVEIVDAHTNIVKIKRNDEVIFEKDYTTVTETSVSKEDFSVNAIYNFAETVVIDDIKEVIETQIFYNTRIANEGLEREFGANVGKTLINNATDIKTRAKAYAAAGADARMAGSTLPVIINAGSGNQGITVSLPVIKYAENLGVSKEKLIRALVFSNLLAIYQKSGIGKLSAYCGVVTAACAAGAGISYLYELSLDTIKMTIKNTLCNVSGIVCDGAKSSCAAKIASSVDAAIMGHEMAMNGQSYSSGEGINSEDVDITISNIAHLAKEGMKETDICILNIMLKNK